MMRRPITATILGVVASLAIASSALAHECTNGSKSDQAAGAGPDRRHDRRDRLDDRGTRQSARPGRRQP